MKKGKIGILERRYVAEKLARQFYAQLGYSKLETSDRDYMSNSKHPMEIACYQMALDAIELFMNID